MKRFVSAIYSFIKGKVKKDILEITVSAKRPIIKCVIER